MECMLDRALYSIQESRRLLGGISRNTIYDLMRTGKLASVLIGSRRFISADAIADLIARSTTTIIQSRSASRRRALPDQQLLPLPLPKENASTAPLPNAKPSPVGKRLRGIRGQSLVAVELGAGSARVTRKNA